MAAAVYSAYPAALDLEPSPSRHDRSDDRVKTGTPRLNCRTDAEGTVGLTAVMTTWCANSLLPHQVQTEYSGLLDR